MNINISEYETFYNQLQPIFEAANHCIAANPCSKLTEYIDEIVNGISNSFFLIAESLNEIVLSSLLPENIICILIKRISKNVLIGLNRAKYGFRTNSF